MKEASVYIHIPFCIHKCSYCDFYSLINHKNIFPFLTSLEIEIEYFQRLYSKDYQFTTVFLGGGTPSLIEPRFIGKLIDKLNKSFSFVNNPEITLEANPGTLNKNNLAEFKHLGINRLSIGVQSFDDDDLKFLTRIHNKNDALKTIDIAHKLGFDNINMDLMFSIPSQSLSIWENNLKIATSLPVQHISAYSLTLERGTPLFYQVQSGKTNLHSIDSDADVYEFTMDYLSDNGFIQYEVSNYAHNGKECKHNVNYWSHVNYLGFGPSAHSFWGDIRWSNFSALSRYLSEIDKKENAIMSEEVLGPTEFYNERIFLGLRSKGLDLKRFKNDFEIELYESEKVFFDELIKNNFMVKNGDMLSLTKKGYLLCDEICKQLTI